MRSTMTSALTLLALSASLAGCGKAAPKTDEAATKGAPSAASSASPASPHGDQKPQADLAGTVVETMNSGGYTYLKLKTASGDVWAAVNQVSVKVGDQVTVAGSMPMDGFESPTLNRKFDRIYFGSILPPAGADLAGAPAGPPADGKARPAMPPGHGAMAKPVDEAPIKVDRASGADGKTVAELFSGKAALKDKPVAVRGKVVKFLPDIMGKNWVHIRDGSGSANSKDNDLTVTTKEKVAVGDIVLVRGKLQTDKDIGAGYQFPAIIEDATFTK